MPIGQQAAINRWQLRRSMADNAGNVLGSEQAPGALRNDSCMFIVLACSQRQTCLRCAMMAVYR